MNHVTWRRYSILEGSRYGSGFIVYDESEHREICGCAVREDADMIVRALCVKEVE